MAAKPGTCANPGISIMSLPFLNRSTQISKWRDQLRQRFSPSRYLRRSDGLRLLAAGGAGSEWVIARGRCAYTVLDGGAVPAARRPAFGRIAVKRRAPFSSSPAAVPWATGKASVRDK